MFFFNFLQRSAQLWLAKQNGALIDHQLVFIENVKGDRAGSWETGVGGVGIKMTPINLKGFRVDLFN